MAKDKLYQKIIEDYKITRSVKRTAENLGTTLVRAQRVLITEGLWSSPTSEEIWRLSKAGMDVKSIADKLCVTEKTVQAYLPYTKGYYSDNVKSNNAIRSGEYRGRKKSAAKARVHFVENKEKKKDVIHYTDLKDGLRALDVQERHVHKSPLVFRLHLQLDMKYLNEEDKQTLCKYGKVVNEISRDIIASADMTLHALHYAIQRAFGWENCHLHKYSFDPKTFNLLTGGKRTKVSDDAPWFVLYDGYVLEWIKRCGTYFRFPTDDLDDLYWDDDYDGEVSVKSWLSKKYNQNDYYCGESEHFVNAKRAALSFVEENEALTDGGMTIGEAGEKMILEHDPNELLERLKLGEVLFPIGENSIDDRMLEEQDVVRELLYEKMVGKYTATGRPKAVSGIKTYDAIPWCEDDVRVMPVTSELLYFYDYGDDWEVKISCVDAYYINDRYDDNEGGFVVAQLDDSKAIEEMRVYNIRGERIDGEEAKEIASAYYLTKPVCVGADGLPVMDDVHGVQGYAEFLREIHEGEPEAREELRSWARGMGWTGRMAKKENIL